MDYTGFYNPNAGDPTQQRGNAMAAAMYQQPQQAPQNAMQQGGFVARTSPFETLANGLLEVQKRKQQQAQAAAKAQQEAQQRAQQQKMFEMLHQTLMQQQTPQVQEMVPGQYSTVNPQYG